MDFSITFYMPTCCSYWNYDDKWEVKGQQQTVGQILYSMGVILCGNDSALSSTEPQWHNNQHAQTTPINRAALKEERVERKVKGWNRSTWTAQQNLHAVKQERDKLIPENRMFFYFQTAMKTLKKILCVSKSHKSNREGVRVVNHRRNMLYMYTDLAMTEETLRMVVLEWLQTIGTPEFKERHVREKSFTKSLKTFFLLTVPDSAQAHLFTGELSWSFHAVILSFGLQVNIQADAEPRNLIGQKLVSRAWSLQFSFEHINLTLHGLRRWQKKLEREKLHVHSNISEYTKMFILEGCHQCVHCALPSSSERGRREEISLGTLDSAPPQHGAEL